MAESYPDQWSAAIPASGGGELQRLTARLKQDEVQLAADQRHLKQQRISLERLKAELDVRQQEIDALVQSLLRERQLFEEQKYAAEQALDAQRAPLHAQQEALVRQTARLQEAEQNLETQTRQVENRQHDLQDRLRQLQAQVERFQTQQHDLEAGQKDLLARQQELDERQGLLEGREADLQARATSLSDQQRDAEGLTEAREQLQRRQQELQQQADNLARAQQQVTSQQGTLREQEAALRRQQDAFRDQQAGFQDRQADLQRQIEQVQADQRRLREQTPSLETERLSLSQQKAALERQQADLADAHKLLQRRQAEFTDLQARGDGLARDRRDLRAQQAALQQQQEQAAHLETRLAEKQRHLEELETQLGRWQHSLEVERAADKSKQPTANDAKSPLAGEQVVALTRRLQGLQSELEQLRGQKQKVVAERDELAQLGSALQGRLDVLMAAQKSKPVVVALSPPASLAPADDLAALAAQAVEVRRRTALAGRSPRNDKASSGVPLVAGAALLVGLLVGLVLFGAQSARYWLQAHIVFVPDSPLAEGAELAKAQRELGGRLLEARLPGAVLAADRLPVVAEPKASRLTVQLLTVSPEPSRIALCKILAEYCSELEGEMQGAARARQGRETTDQVAVAEMQINRLAADRQALQAEAEKLQPQAKAHEAALAAAEKTRKELEEAGRKGNDIGARLRVLQRTPPGARMELTPERLAAAAAGDVQLAEVRGQVTARAAELRTLLGSLLTSGTQKCDQMDAQLDGFGKFLAGQQEQMSDDALRMETGRIGEQAASLKGIVQRARKKISDLSGVLAKSQDVAQAGSLVAVQAQSEKTLESLTSEAAAQIKQVDDLLEKIPAGGVDVTRRTVLQQRLRSHFAQVQKTQRDMSETLDGLRPAVNFRLDAALTAVSGLARRLEERQKTLAEQIQQQDAQSRRQDYDRQLQQARSEQDEFSIERDRLIARLTEATGEMLSAEPGRARWDRVRAQLDDLDHRMAAAKAGLEAGQQKQTNLQAAASQPAAARLDEPQILLPAINRGARIGSAVVGGLIVSLLVFGGYVLATRHLPVRRSVVPAQPELAASRN